MMIRTGPGFRLEMRFDEHAKQVEDVVNAIDQTKPAVLTAIGQQTVAYAVSDYRERSQGGTAGGIQWRPVTDGAIRSRLAARAPWQDLSTRMKDLKGDTSDKAKKKRETIRRNRRKLIDKEKAAAEIGVDTGRLVNSLVYGVSELAKIKTPRLRPGGGQPTKAIFDINGNSIKVGTVMKYAEYFDKLRPIFPDGFLDNSRLKELEITAQSIMQKAIDKVVKG